MRTQVLSPEGVAALNDLVTQVYQDLTDPEYIHFFRATASETELIVRGDGLPAFVVLDTLDENRAIIDSVAGSSVVYAIWVRNPAYEKPVLHYIGHVSGKGARSRMINHFVRKDPRTGAQLPNVLKTLNARPDTGLNEVGVSFVRIEPEAVRLYVEDVLIRVHQPEWNIKSTERKKPDKPVL